MILPRRLFLGQDYHPGLRVGMVLTLIAIAGWAGGAIADATPRRSEATAQSMVEVPNLIGLGADQAEASLRERGLRLGKKSLRRADEKGNSVVDQHPPGGARVPSGAAVDVLLGPPPPAARPVKVPDLTGQTLTEAEASLAGRELKLGPIARRQSDQPPETVVDQAPVPGTTSLTGSPVGVWLASPLAVMSATPLVRVPDVTGLDQTRARSKLAAAELLVGRVEEQRSDREPGTVVGQQPVAGVPVDVGTAVDITVASSNRLVAWLLAFGLSLLLAGALARYLKIRRKARPLRPDLRVARTEPGRDLDQLDLDLHREPDVGDHDTDRTLR